MKGKQIPEKHLIKAWKTLSRKPLPKVKAVKLRDQDPDLGPLVWSCGEIYRYELVADGTCDLMELRTLNDWVVIPRLLRVPGVADVTNFGDWPSSTPSPIIRRNWRDMA